MARYYSTMAANTNSEPATWREGRRLRALQLSEQGWTVGQIAAALGVTHGAVSQWLGHARAAGAVALLQQPRPGRPARLTPSQQAQVPELLRRGAKAWGFVGERWTCGRVAEVLDREFDVQYHPAHVSRLLDRWGWSLQKPRCLARERDEAEIRRWREAEWPALRKRGPPPAGGSCSWTKQASSCCPRSCAPTRRGAKPPCCPKPPPGSMCR